MLKINLDKTNGTTLRWPPAKIISIQSLNNSTRKDSDDSSMPEESLKEKKQTNCTVKFCEPVFKPKKHDFL